MKILIIGGAGYIGSHVAREFLDSGYTVTVFDNLSTGTKDNLFSEANFIEGDILNYKDLLDALKQGFDGIVHLAAKKGPGESMDRPDFYAENNIVGTVNILNAMVASNVPNIVFSSSAAVYGNPEYLPMDEKHPKNPENFYGYTKLEIENMLKWYSRLKNINFSALRYFNAAGYDVKKRIMGLERNPANLLPRVMEVAVGKVAGLEIYGDDYDTPDGTCVRDYIHVSDLASAHVKSMQYISGNKKSVILNLGTEKGLSVKEIVEKARKITKMEVPATVTSRRPGDPSTVCASSQKAFKVLNWQPQYSKVETLLESMWFVYKHHYKK